MGDALVGSVHSGTRAVLFLSCIARFENMWRARGPRRFERQRARVRGAAATLVIATLATLAIPATRTEAEPLVVVVRDGGEAALAVARLRGQVADLKVELIVAPGAVEPGLDAQLATAARLARTRGARVVVWFVARGRGLAVAIATPADHRLFVREIPAADASAVAEAAAVAARGALRAIGEGGTIGVEVAAPVAAEADARPSPTRAPRRFGLELAVGWQVALDAGADAGAHAIAQRTSVTRGGWAATLGLTLGPALRRAIDPATAPGTAIELSRSTATLGIDRRLGGFALGVTAGVLVVHRTTVATSGELAPTPAATTTAFVAGPVARWRWRPGGGQVGIEVLAGLDLVAGAPELAIARGDEVSVVGALRAVQPRFALSIFAGLP